MSTSTKLTAGTAYTIEDLSTGPDRLRQLAELLAANDDPRLSGALQWQYLQNPCGKPYAKIAVYNGTIAGFYAIVSTTALINGRTRQIAQSLDTITDREHRGRGLFGRLAAAVYRQAEEDGVSGVYGFPNGSSAFGFFKRLSWTRLDPVPFMMRPLRTRYLLERVNGSLGSLPDLRLPVARYGHAGLEFKRADGRFGPQHQELWRTFAGNTLCAVDRSADYLNWRLADKPHAAYERLEAYEAGDLAGFVVHRVTRKHGGVVGYLMELIVQPGRADIARALLSLSLRRMRDRGADVALAWSLPQSPTHGALRQSGFFNLPERMRPIELHFGACAFQADAELMRRRDSWYLSYCDSDTV